VDIVVLVLLILIGFGLIAAEVYIIPGLNVVGILGILVLIFAIGFAFTSNGLIGGFFALAGTTVLGLVMAFAMWRSGSWEEFVLSTSILPGREIPDKGQENRGRFIGKAGQALTPLRPAGVAEIDGERVEVQTEGGFIAADSRIKVVAIDSRHIFVRLDTSTQPEVSEVRP
jgi:membrane-bound serine protease (ClpP class)